VIHSLGEFITEVTVSLWTKKSGLTGALNSVEVTYESSYLPFMSATPAEASTSASTKWKGRRKFNARGEETSATDPVCLLTMNT
jgi:hypothetical protein